MKMSLENFSPSVVSGSSYNNKCSRVIRSTCPTIRKKSKSMVVVISAVVLLIASVSSDPVYVRSSRFGQLVTSSTLRWFKGIAKDPVTLSSTENSLDIVCRVWNTGKIFSYA